MATANLRAHIPPRPRRKVRTSPLMRVRRLASRPTGPDAIPAHDGPIRDAYALGTTLGALYNLSHQLDLARLEAFTRGIQATIESK